MKVMGVAPPDYTLRTFDVAEPVADPTGVVIDVLAASVNAFDYAAANGGCASRAEAPILLGRDVVGTVSHVGSQVIGVQAGMTVAAVLPVDLPTCGSTFTDRVLVPADLIAPVPDGLGLITAAAIGLSGITAVDALDALSINGLETVLIYGPLTAASQFALQLAKRRGAVIAVVTDAPATALAWSLGADVVMPGRRNTHQMIAAVRNIMGANFDTAVTTTSDPTVVAAAVRTGGTFTSLQDCGGHTLRSSSGFTPTLIRPTAHKLTNLLFQAAAGQLSAKTLHTINFDQIPEVLADASSCHHHIVATH